MRSTHYTSSVLKPIPKLSYVQDSDSWLKKKLVNIIELASGRDRITKIYDELNKHNDEMLEAQELDANIILNQAEIFFNEINTINLGGGIKVVRIDLTDTDKAGCLENYLENPTDNSFIVVKSGKLGPKSKLRGLFEKSERFIVIPFYEDTIKDTHGFIENYLNANNFSISNDAKQKIISFSGQTRLINARDTLMFSTTNSKAHNLIVNDYFVVLRKNMIFTYDLNKL